MAGFLLWLGGLLLGFACGWRLAPRLRAADRWPISNGKILGGAAMTSRDPEPAPTAAEFEANAEAFRNATKFAPPGEGCVDCGCNPLFSCRQMAGPLLCHVCAHKRLAAAWLGPAMWAIVDGKTNDIVYSFNSRPVAGVMTGEIVVEGRFLDVGIRGLQIRQREPDVPA